MLSRSRFPQLSVQFSVQSEITALAGKTYRHNSCARSFLARLNVLALSDVMEAGVPRLPTNR